MLGKWIFPLLSVWSIAGYIHLLHLLHVFDIIKSKSLISLLFLPVLALEFYFGLHFPHGSLAEWDSITSTGFLLFTARSLYWFAFFIFWVIFMNFVARKAVVIKFFITQFYFQFYVVYRAQRWLTFLALFVWVALYYFITVRWGAFRIVTAMVVPIGLTFFLLYHLYHFGGMGGIRKGKVLRQPGVERPFEFTKIGAYPVPRHPREIYFDKVRNSLFVMFGATYGQRDIYPTIIRRDLDSGQMRAFASRNIRQISFDERSRCIFVAPWYQEFFYKLSMQDLKIIMQYPNQVKGLLQTWEPMDVLKDISEDRIYIGNDAEQALISYHSETGRLEKMLNLLEQKAVGVGGPVWHIRQSRKTRLLYFITGPGMHLFEVDPDSLTILKRKKFFDVVGTALEIDDDNQWLYYQNGGIDSLYKIDMATFEIKRRFKGEGHSRCIQLDKKRNALYVLGYLSGTIFPIDLGTGKRPWKIHVGGLPHGMYLYEDILWVNSMSGVLRLDLDTIWSNC